MVDYRPFIIADADTGHGGDAHVRNLIRRFVEVGVPGYHIEDQKPGCKKCGHQGGKVLVPVDEQIKRLNAARFQLDVMGVPGIIVARTDAEAATFLDSTGDGRDQPFVLGATNLAVPSWKVTYLAILKRFNEMGIDEINGHLLYEISDGAYRQGRGVARPHRGLRLSCGISSTPTPADRMMPVETMLDQAVNRFADLWEAEAGIKTFGQAVADAMSFHLEQGQDLRLHGRGVARVVVTSLVAGGAGQGRASFGINVDWDPELARTPEGYYPIKGGIPYAIAKSLAVAPFCDIIWMETKTANLHDARRSSPTRSTPDFPDKMLAYNLSPSFNWDTTGMTDEEMTAFPTELGKLGFVFNFITYGGHQVDGMAVEEFARALKEDGMLALAKLQRKLRLVESPYKTPQTLVGGPRLDGALMASSGRTATTKAMGKGSTQVQHLVETEVPPRLLEEWLDLWREEHGIGDPLTGSAPTAEGGLRAAPSQHPEPRGRRGGDGGLRHHQGPPRQEHPLDPRPGDHRHRAAAETSHDHRPPLPHPPLQGRVDPLCDPDRRQRQADRRHAEARHLRRCQQGDRRHHRRRDRRRPGRRVCSRPTGPSSASSSGEKE